MTTDAADVATADPLAALRDHRIAGDGVHGLYLLALPHALRLWAIERARISPTHHAGVRVDLSWATPGRIRMDFHTPAQRYARAINASGATMPEGEFAGLVGMLAGWLDGGA